MGGRGMGWGRVFTFLHVHNVILKQATNQKKKLLHFFEDKKITLW